jgi:acetyltransferase-like isoleucine patch superfamily enzyme
MFSDSAVTRALNTPWKVWNEIWRWLAYPWIRLLFAWNRLPWGSGWRFYGVPIIQKHRQSQMVLGADLQLRSSPRSNPLGPNRPVILATWKAGATLKIGDNFGMTGGTVCVAQKITIGSNVTVGANSTITDTDFHPLDPALRREHPAAGACGPVTIEDGVFIGMNCTILKGVTIGQNSIIGAGSVVTGDIPPNVIAGGVPARPLRSLDDD